MSENTVFIGDSIGPIINFIEEIVQAANASEASELKAIIDTALNKLDFDFVQQELPSAVDQSKEGLNRITKIVAAMKDFSHPDETAEGLADVNRAIEATSIISAHRWKLVADLEANLGELPSIWCYIDELNQVILNMIVNAADAINEKYNNSGTKGTITIETSATETDIKISIGDNGNGMSNEVKDRIFEPFFTTKDVGKGTGQGLSISYDIIVTRHQGTLVCKSELGEGTTFIMTLPIK